MTASRTVAKAVGFDSLFRPNQISSSMTPASMLFQIPRRPNADFLSIVFSRRRRTTWRYHFLPYWSARFFNHTVQNVPESSAREPWPRARSQPGRCTTAEGGGQQLTSTCRAGCLCATPSSWCRDVQCRCTLPGGARVLAGCEACRPRTC